MFTSPRDHHQPVDEARQSSTLILFIESLPAAASIRRLYKSLADVEKLGSSLEIRNKGLAVGTSGWGYR